MRMRYFEHHQEGGDSDAEINTSFSGVSVINALFPAAALATAQSYDTQVLRSPGRGVVQINGATRWVIAYF